MISSIIGSLFWIIVIYFAVKKKFGNKKGALSSLFFFGIYCILNTFMNEIVWMKEVNVVSFFLLPLVVIWIALPDIVCSFARYKIPFVNRSNIFKGRKVLIIIPHQDDDVNLMGTLITEYIHYKSEVYLLFFSDDSFRIKEALLVAKQQGIPRRNVRFKSYSEYAEQEKSYIEKEVEYFIKKVRPNVIFSVDRDAHPDHKLVSDAFDEVFKNMQLDNGNITVFKGFAYQTAWTAKDDFYEDINLKSTLRTEEVEALGYKWNERIRFPVSKVDLNRCKSGCRSYWNLYLYKSQNAVVRAGRVMNGDKVFWCISKSNYWKNWIKFMDEEENFIYDYLLREDEKEVRLSIYDTRGKHSEMSDYRVFVLKQMECGIEEMKSCLCLKFYSNKAFCHIRVEDQDDPQIYDEVIVRSRTTMDKIVDKLAFYVDRAIGYRIITMYYDFLYLLNV